MDRKSWAQLLAEGEAKWDEIQSRKAPLSFCLTAEEFDKLYDK